MTRMRFPAGALIVFLLAWAAVASAQNVSTGTDGLSVKGFIDTTAFLQNQNFTFGNGQNAEFPNPPQTKTHRWFLDGDVRNTRVTLGFNGPKLENGLKLNATLEGDFFGGFNGTGAFSNAQATPRLRLAYVDLVRGKTFPLGYGAAGDVGWRFPGIFLYHDLSPSMKLTLGVMRNTWNGPGNNIDSGSAGPASTLPQIEGRLDWNGKRGASTWNTYAVGHVDQKNLNGAGAATRKNLSGWAGEFGGKLTSGAVMIQGNAYVGKAIGQQFGQITQFGDIKSWGVWAQAGYNVTKRWSALLFGGFEKPKKEDVIAAKQPRVKNLMLVPAIMYNLGPYGFNVEWLRDRVTTAAASGAETNTTGDQIAASVIFKF